MEAEHDEGGNETGPLPGLNGNSAGTDLRATNSDGFDHAQLLHWYNSILTEPVPARLSDLARRLEAALSGDVDTGKDAGKDDGAAEGAIGKSGETDEQKE